MIVYDDDDDCMAHHQNGMSTHSMGLNRRYLSCAIASLRIVKDTATINFWLRPIAFGCVCVVYKCKDIVLCIDGSLELNSAMLYLLRWIRVQIV